MPEPAAELVDELADLVDPAPVLSTEVVFDGRIWEVRRDQFHYGDATITREYVDHPGAVAVLALDAQDRVLLIRQYRHAIRSRDWELPAGLLDIADEDPLHAAQRELDEEVDLTADSWSVLIDFFTSPGGSNESVRVYLATGLSPTGTTFDRREEEADIEKRWLPLGEVVSGVVGHRLHNSILCVAVLAAHALRS
jgi:8-oxo-dGTP pyrophosphatase MutT (NUDIX family)